jgi:Lrp/AsnC family leucine-responsive transcriptional regulator
MEALDGFDRRILTILQAEGRLSNQDLADRVALSPSACLRRTRRLEEDGYILGYRAELDPQKLGLGVNAFVKVTMEQHSPEIRGNFARAIALIPEVMDCHIVTGDGDYLLRVVARDLAAYADFVMARLLAIPGIRIASSTIVLETWKHSRILPL